jgi:hypothetical protein
LEDYAPTGFSWLGGFSAVVVSAMVSSVVVSRFFLMCFGGWEIFLMCFRGWAVFSAVLWCFFLLLMALALPLLYFSTFLEVIRD